MEGEKEREYIWWSIWARGSSRGMRAWAGRASRCVWLGHVTGLVLARAALWSLGSAAALAA